jgi:hypothetical protein
MAPALGGLIEGLTRYPRDWLLPRRIDLRKDEPIRSLKGGQEIVKEITGPAIPVRLKDHGNGTLPAVANGLERRLDFHRMMSVIVDHHDPLGLPFDLEAAMDATEGMERLRDPGKGNLELLRDRHRGEGVGGGVSPGQTESEPSHGPRAVLHGEFNLHGSHLEILGAKVGLSGETIRRKALSHLGKKRPHAGMVQTQDRQPVERHLVDEGEKTVHEAVHRLIKIHMLAVDVGHHGDSGREEQKGAIALIRLGDQKFPLSELGVAPERFHPSPDHHRGVKPGGAQNRGDH